MHPPITGEHSLPELAVHRLPKRWPVRWSDWNLRRVAENVVFGLFALFATVWVLQQATVAHDARHLRDQQVCVPAR